MDVTGDKELNSDKLLRPEKKLAFAILKIPVIKPFFKDLLPLKVLWFMFLNRLIVYFF